MILETEAYIDRYIYTHLLFLHAAPCAYVTAILASTKCSAFSARRSVHVSVKFLQVQKSIDVVQVDPLPGTHWDKYPL